MRESPERIDFFISYTEADGKWAEWIAWELEAVGFTTVLQAWDFRPGSNFVLDMDQAARRATRTIAVLSPSYIASLYAKPEWAAAFAEDPTGEEGLLIPVRVHECDLRGLLKSVIYIDLVGRPEDEARRVLVAGVEVSRAKPLSRPLFPTHWGQNISPPETKVTEGTGYESLPTTWTWNISQVDYINVPRLWLYSRGPNPYIDAFSASTDENLSDLGIVVGQITLAAKQVLLTAAPQAIELEDVELDDAFTGALISFNHTFRTKNLPSREKVMKHRFRFIGDLRRDPHLYWSGPDFKLVLVIDPKWVTTNSAFVHLKRGISRFAGLAIVRRADREERCIYATPYILGTPWGLWDDMLSGAAL